MFTAEEVEGALKKRPVKFVALIREETSTGALQDLDAIPETVHRRGGLVLLECVTSLGGVPVKIDEWDVGAAFSGTQKVLSCPPGLVRVSRGLRAVEALH